MGLKKPPSRLGIGAAGNDKDVFELSDRRTSLGAALPPRVTQTGQLQPQAQPQMQQPDMERLLQDLKALGDVFSDIGAAQMSDLLDRIQQSLPVPGGSMNDVAGLLEAIQDSGFLDELDNAGAFASDLASLLNGELSATGFLNNWGTNDGLFADLGQTGSNSGTVDDGDPSQSSGGHSEANVGREGVVIRSLYPNKEPYPVELAGSPGAESSDTWADVGGTGGSRENEDPKEDASGSSGGTSEAGGTGSSGASGSSGSGEADDSTVDDAGTDKTGVDDADSGRPNPEGSYERREMTEEDYEKAQSKGDSGRVGQPAGDEQTRDREVDLGDMKGFWKERLDPYIHTSGDEGDEEASPEDIVFEDPTGGIAQPVDDQPGSGSVHGGRLNGGRRNPGAGDPRAHD
jgi:hypothetical protein